MTLYWGEASLCGQDTGPIVRVTIPYFGLIQQDNGPALSTGQYMTSALQPRSTEQSSQIVEALKCRASQVALNDTYVDTQSAPLTYDNLDQPYADAALTQVLHFSNQTISACAEYPGLAAGTNCCALQGLDMAYFDNLMMYQDVA